MKFTYAALITLLATGAVAQRRGGRGGGRSGGGGGAGAGGGDGSGATAQICRVSASVIPVDEAIDKTGGDVPSNLDGARISAQACAGVGGQSFSGCCVKNDCAGAGTDSACLAPGGEAGFAGSYTGGPCPAGLRCFLRSA